MIYFIVLFLLVLLSVRYDINGRTKYRDQWYNAVLIILILIAGLRFRLGEDTIRYIWMFYHDTPILSDFDIDALLSSGQSPLWLLLNCIVKTIGGKFFVVQLIQAAIVNTLILKYFKKHSSYPFACVLFYFIWRYQWFSMVVMKAAIALSIMLFANDYFLGRKYIKGLMLMLIAIGFHLSSIVLLVVPFLSWIRFNRTGVVLLISAFFVGAFLQSKLGDIFQLVEFAEGTSRKLNNYLDSGYMRQDHNINYFILQVFPLIIYPIISIVYLKRNCRESQVLRLEPFVMIALIFQMMQFSINIMYRFIYALSPYYIIFIIHYIVEFSEKSLKLKKSLAFVRTFVIVSFLLFSIVYIWRPFTHPDFNPYSSVIERSFDNDREKYYSEFITRDRRSIDEY